MREPTKEISAPTSTTTEGVRPTDPPSPGAAELDVLGGGADTGFTVSTRGPRRITVTVRGGAAIVALTGLVALPHLFARSLEPAEAEAKVRDHMLADVTSRLLAERRGGADPVSDAATARRWIGQLERIHRMRFRSVEVRRALLVPPLRRRTNFAVRVTVADAGRPDRTLYFWLFGSGASSVAESSRLWWSLPL